MGNTQYSCAKCGYTDESSKPCVVCAMNKNIANAEARAAARDEQEIEAMRKGMQEGHDASMQKMMDKMEKQNEKNRAEEARIRKEYAEDQKKMQEMLTKQAKQAEQREARMKRDMVKKEKNFKKNFNAKLGQIQNIQQQLREKYPPPVFYQQLMKDLQSKYGKKASHVPIVALCGGTGEGKSSWLNACLGHAAARVGGAGECTLKLDHYEWCPDGDNPICFIDCPGGGTLNFPADEYVRTIGLRYYDVVLFFCNKRFKETDTQIIHDCKRHKIIYFAVKTQVQASIDNYEFDCDNQGLEVPDEEEICEQLKRTLYSMPSLATGKPMLTGVPMEDIFLSDSRDFYSFDTMPLLRRLATACRSGRSRKVVKKNGQWVGANEVDNKEMARLNSHLQQLEAQTKDNGPGAAPGAADYRAEGVVG